MSLYEDVTIHSLKQAYDDFVAIHGVAPTVVVVSRSVETLFNEETLRYGRCTTGDAVHKVEEVLGMQIIKTPRRDITVRLY